MHLKRALASSSSRPVLELFNKWDAVRSTPVHMNIVRTAPAVRLSHVVGSPRARVQDGNGIVDKSEVSQALQALKVPGTHAEHDNLFETVSAGASRDACCDSYATRAATPASYAA